MKRIVRFSIALLVALVLASPRPVLSHETVTTTVLFDREIVRILDSHCVMCHVEGGLSFPLVTYEQVWLQKRKISAEVLARHMPPWAALPGYGRFANENVVTLRESQFIVSWMEGLGPRNAGRVFTNTAAQAGAQPPAAVRAHMDFGAWQLGQPDLERELAATTIAPGRADDVRRSMIDVGTNIARNVRAFEYIPGDRRVVRAAFFTVQETGQWIGGWTPWYGAVRLPAGVVYRIPAGAHIAAEIHYRHKNEPVVDRGRIGLSFETAARVKPVSDLVLDVTRDGGPTSSERSVRLHGDTLLAADTTLLALRPDAVNGLTSMEVTARRPDGGTDVLLFAKDVHDAWPTPYIFKDPVLLRRGTRLSMTAYGTDALAASSSRVRLTVSSYSAAESVQPRR